MPLPQIGQYDIRVTDYFGAIWAHLDTATVTKLKWQSNGMGSGQITLPLNDPHLWALIDTDGNVIDEREIQVYLNSNYLQTIVPAPKSSPSLMTIDGADPTYHLKRRYVGRLSSSPNVVLNPTFATDLTNWTASAGTTQTWVSSPAHVGTGAIELVSASVGDHYSSQSITITSQPFDRFAWVTGWLYVAPGVDPADLVQGRSLFTVWSIGATEVWRQGVRANWRIIGNWQRLKFKVFVPQGNTYTLNLRLYSPLGTVYYDDLEVRLDERLYVTGDPATIVGALVVHAQSTSIGKVSANIGFAAVGSGTAQVTRAYKYSERAPILAAIDEMRSLQGGVDYHLEQDGHLRVLTTYDRTGFTPPGGMQTLKWDVAGGDEVNIADFTWAWNPDYRADKVIVGGRGSGDDFTEGFYDDPSSNLGWELFRPATIEGSVDPQAVAAGYGEIYERPETLRVTIHRTTNFDPAILIANGDLKPCRLVRCIITQGPIQFDEECKILDIELNPEPDTATLNLVPVASISP